MPVAFEEKVRALSSDLGSQARLAEALDVNRSQLTRWLRGSGTDDATALRVDVLEMTLSALLRVYSPRVAMSWLYGVNPFLRDRRPIDLVRRGEAVELLDAIRQEQAGSYA